MKHSSRAGSEPCGRWRVLLLVCLLAFAAAGQESEPRVLGPYPAREGETCVVCNSPTSAADIAYVVDGQRVAIRKEMEAAFLANPRKYLAAFGPEGMLFSGNPSATPNWTVFLLGSYVLAGVLFGALCAQLAMQRKVRPAVWFLYGFFGNVFAWALLRASPAAERVELPAGMRKISSTSDPLSCGHCGKENHPLASRCLHCGADLTPAAASEASREKREEGSHD